MERLVSKARGDTNPDEKKELEGRLKQVEAEREEKSNELKEIIKSLA